MRKLHLETVFVALVLSPGCQQPAENEAKIGRAPRGLNPSPPIAAHAGLAYVWEGQRSHEMNRMPGRPIDMLHFNPGTGGYAMRMTIADWAGRLPATISLAYDSQRSDPAERFKLDWDRRATTSDSGATVVIEDRDLRPLTFTGGPNYQAPLGVHAELTATVDGGWDLVHYDRPDITEHFAPVNSVCCFLTSKKDTYNNTITVQRDTNLKITSITPAGRPAVTVSYDLNGKTSSVAPHLGTATFAWDGDDLVSYSPPSQSGSYIFQYSGGKLSRVTWPGGGWANIVTESNDVTTSIEFVDNLISANYAATSSAAGVELIDKFQNLAQLTYEDGVFTAQADPDGTISYTYDTDRNLTEVTGKGGELRSRTVDSHGHELTNTDDTGTTTTYTWSDDRLATSTRDGVTTTFTRNTQGRLLTAATSGGGETQTTTYTWTSVGLFQSQSAFGVTLSYEYDSRDDLTAIKKNTVTQLAFDYDPATHRMASITSAAGTTAFAYGSSSDLIPNEVTHPSGVVSSIDTSSQFLGSSISVQRPGGASPLTLTNQFDGDGRMTGWQINYTQVATISY